jgi:hypothetical protein
LSCFTLLPHLPAVHSSVNTAGVTPHHPDPTPEE